MHSLDVVIIINHYISLNFLDMGATYRRSRTHKCIKDLRKSCRTRRYKKGMDDDDGGGELQI